MMLTRAEAFAPATMANLGVGFDILGLALREPGDIVRATLREEPGAVVAAIEGDGGKLPRDPHKNTAAVAANSLLQRIHATQGVELTILKNLPLASGLGSSAASAVAGAVAVNALFGSPLSTAELLFACLDGEAAVSGYHADNVAPSLFGGICLVLGTASATDIRRLPIPPNLHLALVTPDVEVPTVLARAALPDSVSLKALVGQTAGLAQVIDALYRGDLEALAAGMEADTIIEPARAHLMPLLAEMRVLAKQTGALGLVISGAGPTLCALCDHPGTAEQVTEAMTAAYQEAGFGVQGRSTQVSEQGARVLQLSN